MDKNKVLQDTMDKLNKTYGQGTVVNFGDKPLADIESISTGSLGLDLALGVRGFPKGRIVEIYGPESSGKTTLTIHAMAEAQKTGGKVAFIDAEHAFDMNYAEAIGVNPKDLIFSQPDNGEQAFEIVDALLQSKAVDLIIVDSVAALTPKAELDGDMGDSKMGLHARLMSQAMRKITAHISKSNTCVIFINQLRDKIGVMFGNPETTTGGNALKFYASVRLDVRRVSQIKDRDGNVVANQTRVKVIKNKCAPPFRMCEFEIAFGVGINKAAEILDIAVGFEIVEKSGSWYSYSGTKLGQGKEGVVQFLLDNPDLITELEDKIYSKL